MLPKGALHHRSSCVLGPWHRDRLPEKAEIWSRVRFDSSIRHRMAPWIISETSQDNTRRPLGEIHNGDTAEPVFFLWKFQMANTAGSVDYGTGCLKAPCWHLYFLIFTRLISHSPCPASMSTQTIAPLALPMIPLKKFKPPSKLTWTSSPDISSIAISSWANKRQFAQYSI